MGVTSTIRSWIALGAVSACALAAGASDYDRYVFIKAGTVITVSGDEIDNGDIIIEDGQITLVGIGLEAPTGARVIEARDQTVMPGLVVSRTREGLPSYRRRGTRADLVAADELYLDEIDFEPMLEHGVTAVAFYPAGDGIPGIASVYRTGGAEDEQQLRRSGYVRATLRALKRDKKTLRDAFNKAQAELDKVEKAKQEWDKKQAQKKAKDDKAAENEGDKPEKPTPKEDDQPDKGKASDGTRAPTPPEPKDPPESGEPKDKPEKPEAPEEFTPPEIDKTVKPLADMIEGRGPRLLVELRGASGVLHVEDALKKHEKVKPAYFVTNSSASDFDHIIEHLGETKARVLTTPDLSQLAYTTVRFNLPGELAAAGAEVSLTPVRADIGQLRQYRADVANLVRSGLRREDAIKAMTLNPARLLGVSGTIGSIEPERAADLIFLDGDPLDPHARVERVMIEGAVIWERDDAEG